VRLRHSQVARSRMHANSIRQQHPQRSMCSTVFRCGATATRAAVARRLTAAAGGLLLAWLSQGDQLAALMLARERLTLRLSASLPSMTVERDVLQEALDFMRTDSDTESDPGVCIIVYDCAQLCWLDALWALAPLRDALGRHRTVSAQQRP
jgi:hypothetical protein